MKSYAVTTLVPKPEGLATPVPRTAIVTASPVGVRHATGTFMPAFDSFRFRCRGKSLSLGAVVATAGTGGPGTTRAASGSARSRSMSAATFVAGCTLPRSIGTGPMTGVVSGSSVANTNVSLRRISPFGPHQVGLFARNKEVVAARCWPRKIGMTPPMDGEGRAA